MVFATSCSRGRRLDRLSASLMAGRMMESSVTGGLTIAYEGRGLIGCGYACRRLRPRHHEPPDLGDGPVQPPVRLLHAGGARLDAAAGGPDVRGDRADRPGG